MNKTATKNLEINVHHITRVEGHGNIVINVHDGILEQCDLEIIETPRFFEGLLRGQSYDQAPRLASRICGICAVAHTTTALRAVEKALGILPSLQTELLRELAYCGEMLDSHLLHVYMLAAPDLVGAQSVIPLAKSTPELVRRALRMKQVAGEICAAVCGRHTHPIAMTVGGFTHFPDLSEIEALVKRLESMCADLDATVELFQTLSLPDFERPTEFIALQKEGIYPFIDCSFQPSCMIASSDGGAWPVEAYKEVTNEYLVSHSTAKHTRNQRQSYMVGALARFNLNYSSLHPRAKDAARALDLLPGCANPYLITIAQVVEIAHCYERSLALLQRLLNDGIVREPLVPPTSFSGEGVAACEAPRGTLYHHYVISSGDISEANCVIPTAQNLANIEEDMRSLVPTLLGRSPEEITHSLEMLVRAYDPCISCSTHMLEVTLV